MKDNPLKKIENDEQFEELCCTIAQFKYGDFDAQKYGRSGQKQWGVDIRATYKKSNNERIVIQCKFKTKPPKFKTKSKAEIKAIQKEMENELAQAINGKNTFQYFIYASNIPRDTNLQNFADSLSTDSYNVIVWCQDDIIDDIYRFERLKQIYTINGTKHGVEIINTDFIDTLKEEEETSNPNIFRYYTSSDINNNQWYGILKSWDVMRNNHFNFLDSINQSFSNESIESKVGGLILGEGGSGKSVFLRRIAIEICNQQKDIVVWWVTDLQSFYSRDISTIEDNPHYKHLVFIEDWYRNVGNDYSYSKLIFNWLKKKNNVRVLIGDRVINNGYRTQITKRNKFLLSLDENSKILETIIGKLPAFKDNIKKLLDNKVLIESAPIFIILFVLSELSENELNINYDELNFENLFKELIGKKIQTLEEDIRYSGMGKGLYVSALLYSDKNSTFFALSERGFLLVSEFLGKNKEIAHRVKSNRAYPEQFDSLVRIEELIFKSGTHLHRLRFNHDLIAEKGISLINETKYGLNFNFDNYEAEKLIQFCIAQNELNTALTISIWLNNNCKNISSHNFFQLFNGNLEKLSGTGLTIYLRTLSREQKKSFTKEILEQKDFFKLSFEIVSHSLRIWQNEDLGKDKAKEILEQNDFLILPYQIVSHSLRIWQNEDLGKDKAKEILEQNDFLKLPFQIVSHCLRIWQNEDLGKDKAKEILSLFLSNKDINTFLIFNSIRIFCKQKSKERIIEEVYNKINSLRKEKKFGRLYFDLLYLPLFHINRHYKRIINTIRNYSYDCALSQKRQLSAILNCFKEYTNEWQDYFDTKELLYDINLNWFRDLEHQKTIRSTEIFDIHIALSISNIHSKSESKKIAKEIIEYCAGNTLLTQQILFKTATEILKTENYEFWK